MIIRIDRVTGHLVAYDNINSKQGKCGNGWAPKYHVPQRRLPLHDTLCGVFAHSRKLRRLALKEAK